MGANPIADRLRRLPRTRALGFDVAVAEGFRVRLLGLSWLEPERAGGGLLIPRCSCVHTLGMRFALDVYFLDPAGRLVELRAAVPPGRVVACRRARATLEIPTPPAPPAGRV